MTGGEPPAPGAAARGGIPVAPREAAAVILVRGAEAGLEVLLLRRNPATPFMGGAWVFPGGAREPGDDGVRATAVREVAEEAGLVLPATGALVPFARWITPPELATRFDTHFFVAVAPAGQQPRADGHEAVDLGWYAPAAALAAHRAGSIELVFPTIRQLEQLAGFGSAAELLRWADGREVVPVEPRVRFDGETARIVLPGDSSDGR